MEGGACGQGAEDLEQQLRAAREQGQLQAVQSQVKDLHHCVVQQEAELQQLRRSLEARQHTEDQLKAEIRMSSTMHKAIRPSLHRLCTASAPPLPPASATTSATAPAPVSCSAPHSSSGRRERRREPVPFTSALPRRHIAYTASSSASCPQLSPSLLLAPGRAQAEARAGRAGSASALAGRAV